MSLWLTENKESESESTPSMCLTCQQRMLVVHDPTFALSGACVALSTHFKLLT